MSSLYYRVPVHTVVPYICMYKTVFAPLNSVQAKPLLPGTSVLYCLILYTVAVWNLFRYIVLYSEQYSQLRVYTINVVYLYSILMAMLISFVSGCVCVCFPRNKDYYLYYFWNPKKKGLFKSCFIQSTT